MGWGQAGCSAQSTGGRSQPLSFGKIPWIDVSGEIQPCDWLVNSHNLEIYTGTVQKRDFASQSRGCISPGTSNHGIFPNDSVNYSD